MYEPDHRGTTVLIVDDDRVVRESVSSYLRDCRYVTVTVRDGRAGLETFLRIRPDILLLNLRIPMVDGLEILATVRTQSPDTPIIVISDVGDMPNVAEALQLGAWDHIVKPIENMSVISESIQRVLERARLMTENQGCQPKPREVRSRTDTPKNGNAELSEISSTNSIESKRCHQTLTSSDTCIRELFDNMSGEVAIYEPLQDGQEFVLRDLNRSGEKMEDSTREQLVGKTLIKAFPGVIEFDLLNVFRRVVATGTPETHAVAHYRDERTTGWRSYHVCRLSSGQIASFCDDTTGQIEAERALYQRESQLSALLASTPDLFVLKNTEGVFQTANKSFGEFFGSSETDIIGKRDKDIMPSDEAQMCTQADSEVINSGESQSREQRITGKKGPRWLSFTRSPIWDTDGQAVGVLCSARDITRRRQMQEALRESEEKFRALTENTSDITVIVDNEGRFVYTSPSVKRTFGYTSEEIIGQPLSELLLPEDVTLFEQALGATQDNPGETVSCGRIRVRHKLGDVVFLDALVTGMVDVPGVYGVVVTGRNVTERVRAEEDREAVIAELEAKNVELEQFGYTVSHDLKSPLITIRGFLGIIEGDIDSERIDRLKPLIHRVSAAADKMQTLLKELLELSRVGRVSNLEEQIDISSLAREAEELVRGQIDQRGVKVTIAPDMPTVHWDKARLLQVFQNLIANAVRFMGDRSDPRIDIGVRYEGQSAVCCVADNGIGIHPKHHDKIFGLFNRLDPSKGGTGIGLALARKIVGVYEGRIWVESEGVGHGATFCFTLPPIMAPAERLPRGQDSVKRSPVKTELVHKGDAGKVEHLTTRE